MGVSVVVPNSKIIKIAGPERRIRAEPECRFKRSEKPLDAAILPSCLQHSAPVADAKHLDYEREERRSKHRFVIRSKDIWTPESFDQVEDGPQDRHHGLVWHCRQLKAGARAVVDNAEDQMIVDRRQIEGPDGVLWDVARYPMFELSSLSLNLFLIAAHHTGDKRFTNGHLSTAVNGVEHDGDPFGSRVRASEP